ncbi:MAG: 3'-5' exonuclease, partial [Chloroflexi bacterium]|nr:3'-5' exonuclease [Chloroflexota bacterium]
MRLIALDLETTGFDPDAERIVEIGAVRFALDDDGLALGERFQTLVDPGVALTPQLRRLTGISDEELVGQPAAPEALARLAAFLAEPADAVVGHNVAFDVAFLERGGVRVAWPRLDTLELAAILLPTAKSYALVRLAAGAGFVPDRSHRALDDALAAAELLGA